MKFFRPIRPLLYGWLFSFLGWGFVALILGAHFVARTGVPWTLAAHAAMRDQLPWAALSPLIFRFASRHVIDGAAWKKNVLAQLLAGALVIVSIQQWKVFLGFRPGPRHHPALIFSSESGPKRPILFGPPPPGWDFFHFASIEIPIYLMIVSAAHTLHFYRRGEIRAGQLASARLQALQAQLRPHFLFNTLNTIAGLVHKSPDAADSALTMLSDLLRFSLDTSAETHVPLQRELEFIKKYLAIMQTRYDERVRYELDITQDALAAGVPALLLQPLVENAVKHAIEPSSDGAKIDIRAWHEGNFLRLIVSDTGPGFSQEETAKEGIGLSSTRARLHELYGEQASLSINNKPGAVVEIKIPYQQVT